MIYERQPGLLTARPSVVYYAMAVIDKMDLGHPYLIETLARMWGDTESYCRTLLWLGENRGRIERSRRAGRTYYMRVK